MKKQQIDIKHLKENWGSNRLITTFTPDTFTKKIILLSTTLTKDGSETAITQISALNHFDIPLNKLIFKTLKLHKTMEDAISFHIQKTNELEFCDAEVSQ